MTSTLKTYLNNSNLFKNISFSLRWSLSVMFTFLHFYVRSTNSKLTRLFIKIFIFEKKKLLFSIGQLYNQSTLTSNSTWNQNAITLANNFTVGADPRTLHIDTNNLTKPTFLLSIFFKEYESIFRPYIQFISWLLKSFDRVYLLNKNSEIFITSRKHLIKKIISQESYSWFAKKKITFIYALFVRCLFHIEKMILPVSTNMLKPVIDHPTHIKIKYLCELNHDHLTDVSFVLS